MWRKLLEALNHTDFGRRNFGSWKFWAVSLQCEGENLQWLSLHTAWFGDFSEVNIIFLGCFLATNVFSSCYTNDKFSG